MESLGTRHATTIKLMKLVLRVGAFGVPLIAIMVLAYWTGEDYSVNGIARSWLRLAASS